MELVGCGVVEYKLTSTVSAGQCDGTINAYS